MQETAKTGLGAAEKVIKRKQSLKAIITISSVVAIPKTSPMWHSHMLKWRAIARRLIKLCPSVGSRSLATWPLHKGPQGAQEG